MFEFKTGTKVQITAQKTKGKPVFLSIFQLKLYKIAEYWQGSHPASIDDSAVLLPKVGADLFNLAFFHPATDDGLHHRRIAIGQTQGHQVLLRELLGQGIQIADVAL